MTFAGLDCSDFPGLATMADLKAASNLTWTGYYLTSPDHPDDSWMGNRAALLEQGWGFAPIYVGQQVGSKKLNAKQGTIDGEAAAELMEGEGFPPRSFCYLDLENGDPSPDAQREYVHAWCAALRDGGYSEGIYCSYKIANQIYLAALYARFWCFRVAVTEPHTILGPPFPTPAPTSCGYPNAFAWQREQNAHIVFPEKHVIDIGLGAQQIDAIAGAHNLLVDLSVATFPDPSFR